MSIIEEALRRKEEETGETLSGRVAPPPLPGPGKKKPGVLAPVLLLFLFLAGAGVAVYFLFARGMAHWRGIPGAGETPAVVAATGTPATATNPAPPHVRNLLDEMNRLAAEAQRAAHVGAGEPPVPGAAAGTESPAASPTAPTPPAGTGETPAAGASPTQNEWPRIELKGILAPGREDTATALLDDQLLQVGDEHRGVRVVEIRKDEIVVEKSGVRRTLMVGQTLP